MNRIKHVILTLLAMAVFALVTTGFFSLLRTRLFPQVQEDSHGIRIEAFPRAVTQPGSTEPTAETPPTTPPQTEPPQTLPKETKPPETLPPETVPPETKPAKPKKKYDTVPLMFMSDYPDIRYRSGTLATSGSNIASLAMVASYLTNQEYRPDELAEFFETYIGNSMQWLEYASDQLKLPWKKAANFHEARKALQEGKLVITLMGEKSIFTQTQHFIVLTGINENGRITVLDPYEDHYSQWNLKQGLAEGFGDNSILTGYQGSWIYDPAEMPKKPFVYKAKKNTAPLRYPGVELTEEEMELMAKLIYMEAQSEPFEGQQAIAEVILNRLVSGNFQSSIDNVIHAEGQFKSSGRLYAAKPTHTQYVAVERALKGPYVLDKGVVFFAAYPVNDDVWGTIGNHTFCYGY